jgi:hypothetical protein
MNTTARPMSLSERADELEHKMTMELERLHTKSALFFMGDGKVAFESSLELQKKNPGKYLNMGDDPRLPKLPEKPTLVDFFKHRMVPNNHLLQSATHALKAGMNRCASSRMSPSATNIPRPTSNISAPITGRTSSWKMSTSAIATTNGT